MQQTQAHFQSKTNLLTELTSYITEMLTRATHVSPIKIKHILSLRIKNIHWLEDIIRITLLHPEYLTPGLCVKWQPIIIVLFVRILLGRLKNSMLSKHGLFDTRHAICQFNSLLSLIWYIRTHDRENTGLWSIIEIFMWPITCFVDIIDTKKDIPNLQLYKNYKNYCLLWSKCHCLSNEMISLDKQLHSDLSKRIGMRSAVAKKFKRGKSTMTVLEFLLRKLV